MTEAQARLEDLFRAEHGRVVAAVVRRFGDLDLAEDAVSEAMVDAMRTWPRAGVPPNPAAWLTTAAHRRALDLIRSRDSRSRREEQAYAESPPQAEPIGEVGDDRLRLMFMCCHPVLDPAAQVALTLRLVAGLTMGEVARAFLVPERTMAQRLTRAKRKLKAERVGFVVPYAEDLPARVEAVGAVIYLIFNEGYVPSTGEPARDELSAEAIRLGRMLVELTPRAQGVMPSRMWLEVRGLLALMLLTQARRAARFDGDRLVPLAEQDRGRWDRRLIAEGHATVRTCLAAGSPAPIRSRRRSMRCTPTATPPTGGRSWISMTCGCGWRRPPWSGSTGPLQWLRSRGRRSRWRLSRTLRWSTISPGRWPGVTSCDNSVGSRSRGRRTGSRSISPTHPPSAPT